MKPKGNTAFLASLFVSVLLAGVFGYEANQYRHSLNDSTELPPEFYSASLQEVEAYLHRRVADATARASHIAALEAAINRQDSERIAALQEGLINEFEETAESARELTVERATQDARHVDKLLQKFDEEKLILMRYIGISLGSLALALTLIAWRVSRRVKGIGFKIIFAAISGFLAWFYFLQSSNISAGFPPPLDWLSVYGLPGMFFAAGVLFPYRVQATFSWLRALGLIVVGSISFRSAIAVAIHFGRPLPVPAIDIDPRAYILASLVGAAIVLTGARFIVPLKRVLELALAGVVAAIVGGLVFEPTEDWPFISFMFWHSLMAVAIHVSENWQWRTG
jgi:hypothetical protein